MPQNSFPFAVRLIGFSGQESAAFEANFAAARPQGYAYFHLDQHNLQDPDLYVADADDLRSLATLSHLRPSAVRPVLLVGSPDVELPYPRLARPFTWAALLDALDRLVEHRADALSRLEASDIVAVPERRRRDRPDLDLTDPAVYERMRAKPPAEGSLLIVDRNPMFRDYLANLLARQNIRVAWAGTELRAVELCEQQPVAMVMINTSTPGVDPYRLCWAIKGKDSPVRITVAFLVGKPFVYDPQQAAYVGADGYLNKPLAGHQLISVVKKFLPFAGRGR